MLHDIALYKFNIHIRIHKDYFDKLYNEVNDTDNQVASSFYNNGNPVEEPDITMDEVRAAIHRLKKNKAPGIDNITVEELVEATKVMGIQAIHRLCELIWQDEKIPDERKHSVIVPIHKKKDKLECSNYRGASLLCQSSKVFHLLFCKE